MSKASRANVSFQGVSHWLRTSPWATLVPRVLVGGVFLLAGFSKLFLPPAEVEVLMRQYQVIPDSIIPWLAALLPWLEVASGTALLIGFLTTLATWLVGLQLGSFLALMLVVLGAGITIEDCGCFGNLGLHETPLQVLIRDLLMLLMLVPVLLRQRDVWSLDGWGNHAESDDHVVSC